MRKRRGPMTELAGAENRITLGGDPELEMFSGGTVNEHAGTYFGFAGVKEGDAGYLGSDCGAVELRPGPGEAVETVLANIHSLLKVAYRGGRMLADKERVPSDVDYGVSGHKLALGAHIHFGCRNMQDMFEDDFEEIVGALDDFLGRRLIDLSGSERARQGYKELGAYDQNDHGFEYRSLPSAILQNPRVCGIVYAIAKQVVRKLSTTGLEYDTVNGMADDAALASLVGQRNVDVLNDFVSRFGPRIRAGENVMLDRLEWLNESKVRSAGREADLSMGGR